MPVSRDVAQWWLEGEEEFLAGDAHTLCAALGLRKSGKQAMQYSERLRRRNEALAYALQFAHEAVGKSPAEISQWGRYDALAVAFKRYDRLRRPPVNPSSLHIAIGRVYAAGLAVPKSATGIHAALKEATQN